MEYTKPFLTLEEQANLLIQRGMRSNPQTLIKYLKDVGYYRLSGYWHIFKNDDDSFRDGTDFSTIWDFYVFDRQLRLLALDAIERVEVYFRAQLAYYLAEISGPFGFADPQTLPGLSGKEYGDLIKKCTVQISRSSESFMRHFTETYGSHHALPPYWILVNTLDFHSMLMFFKGAPEAVQRNISSELAVPVKVLTSWMLALNVVRNISAHHGRLWNKCLGVKPMVPRRLHWEEDYGGDNSRVFYILTILNFLLKTVAPGSHWRDRLIALIHNHPNIDLSYMGAPADWRDSKLWR